MKIKKYAKILVIAIAICYILAVIVSSMMIRQMTQITYNATAFGTTIREDIIDFKGNTAQRNYYDFYGEPTKQKENQISMAKEFKIKTICAVSLFPLWREYYLNPFIMDGDQYSIIRSYGDEQRIIYGSNAYPFTYPLVLYAIDNAFE